MTSFRLLSRAGLSFAGGKARVSCEAHMKSSSFAKAITLGCLVLVAVPVACGDDTSNTKTPASGSSGAGGDDGTAGEGNTTAGRAGAGGAGGASTMLPPGISDVPKTVECSTSCDSAKVGLGASVYYLDPCCGGAGKDECGLSTAFLATAGVKVDQECEPKAQPGPIDDACPIPPGAMIPMGTTMISLDPFPGCCRADTGTCGVYVDAVTFGGGLVPLGKLGLGCLDSTPFFGEPGAACGASGGAGGTGAGGGAGGAVSQTGGADPGGAGGAGGAP
jgi:hypothetical protein